MRLQRSVVVFSYPPARRTSRDRTRIGLRQRRRQGRGQHPACVVIIEPGGHTAGVLQHQGEEVGYVMEGQLELTINREVHLLNAGDSFYFPSDLPHEYRNPGKTRMRAVWINTPPTF